MALIFDREQKDVDTAVGVIEQVKALGFENVNINIRELYKNGMKGCYNLSDINRVYDFISILIKRLSLNGYFPAINMQNYSDNYVFGEYDIKIYLDNIKNLRECISLWKTTPKAPGIAQWIDYKIANDIEKILFDISEILEFVEQVTIYSGNISSSNNIILPQNPLETKIKGNTFNWLDRKYYGWEKLDNKALNWLEFKFKDW